MKRSLRKRVRLQHCEDGAGCFVLHKFRYQSWEQKNDHPQWCLWGKNQLQPSSLPRYFPTDSVSNSSGAEVQAVFGETKFNVAALHSMHANCLDFLCSLGRWCSPAASFTDSSVASKLKKRTPAEGRRLL